MTWEVFYIAAKTFGLPFALLMVGCGVLFWMWKQERNDNRTLNEEVRKNAVSMTEAIVAGTEVQSAMKDALHAVDHRLEKVEDDLKEALAEQRGARRGGKAP